ncbi:hypothetical protein N7488_001464 [Penicillium malachiteum]|nr:hypothetical protein N7488_001464 [Penicillium malachiteum]
MKSVTSVKTLLTQSALAISIVPQHIIGRFYDIDNQPAKLSWFSSGYSLTVGTFILIASRLGDVFGHKPSLFLYLLPCNAGNWPCFATPNAIAIISRCYDPGLRQNMIFSLFGATAPGGFLLGSVFCSLLSQRLWWPWSYWVLSFTCLLLAVLGFIVIPKTPIPRNSALGATEFESSSVWKRIDVAGAVTGIAALVLFNFAWNQGPVVSWTTPYFSMIIGILIFAIFLFIEKRASHPLSPFGILGIDSLFTLA